MATIYDRTTFEPGEIGIIPNLDYDTYRKAPGIAGSDLELLQRSPADFHANARQESTEEMGFGTLFHSLLLEGRADYYVRPETYLAKPEKKGDEPEEKKWNGNALVCKQWLADHADKTILPATGPLSSALLNTMVARAKAHPIVNALLGRLTPEVSVFARYPEHGILCKARIDGLALGDPTLVVEVKTTRDASTEAFSREILKRGYYKKAAWHRMLLHQMKRSPIEYWYIAVENGGQCRVNARRLAERAMDKGDLDNDDAVSLYRKCRSADFWPPFVDSQFPGESPTTPMIDLPDFAYGADVEDLKGLTEVEDEEAKAS